MTHPLTLNYRGAGTPAVVRMVNALSQDTTDLGTLPSAVVDTTNTTDQTIHTSNRVLQMGHRIFALVGTEVYQKDGAGAFVAQSPGIVFGNPGQAPDRGGMQPFMDPTNGPGWFHLYSGPGGTFHVLKYDFLTDAYSITNLGLTTTSSLFASISNFAQIGDQFVGAAERGLVFYNPITDVISTTTSPTTNARHGMTSAKGIAYVAGEFKGANFEDAELRAVLGGTYAFLADLPDTSCRQNSTECQPLVYERNGNVWIAVPRNDNPSGYDINGWRLFEWDTTLNTLTDRSATVLHPLLRRDGGLTVGGFTSGADDKWRFYHHKVVEGPFGAERIFIRAQLGDLNEGSVIFEHTAGGWALIGSSQWTGFFAPVHNPYGDSGFFWSSGELSAMFTAKPVSVSGGVRLDFRVFGDPTFADKVVRVYYSESPGAPYTQAQLANPVGGTGGSSVLSGNDLTQVDANGESGGPTTYSVVHETLAQGIPASADVHWFIEVNTA